MKKIIFDNYPTINFAQIDAENIPIFGMKNNKLVGMIVNEYNPAIGDRWIFRTGGAKGWNGHRKTAEACIKKAMESGYEFFIEE